MAGKFNTMKRFGLEGCESFIPGLKFCIDTAVEEGARTFVMGMPHRGRLNTLANVVRKPAEIIMAEFQGIQPKQGDETGRQVSSKAMKKSYENVYAVEGILRGVRNSSSPR